MWEERGVYGVLMWKLMEIDILGHPGIDGRIILKLIFRNWDVGFGLV
jgi:hypothetical protein